MPIHRYFLSDFVTIQRQSFLNLLEKNIIEEFAKRNPITKKDYTYYFYPEYYILTRPEYTPQDAIIKNKSYTSQLFVPVQITDKKNKIVNLKWVAIGNLPIMTKRGHFILNGAARVIVNQILRSPGVYYQQKIYENYEEKWSQKSKDSYIRYYADLICMRGTWLRIEMDKEKNIWAQMKKGPKIPIYWFLLAMGLSEKKILKTVTDSYKLLINLKKDESNFSGKDQEKKYAYLKNPPEAWQEIYRLLSNHTLKKTNKQTSPTSTIRENLKTSLLSTTSKTDILKLKEDSKAIHPLHNGPARHPTPLFSPNGPYERGANGTKSLFFLEKGKPGAAKQKDKPRSEAREPKNTKNFAEEGRKWLYNKFMNPRS